MEKFREHFDRYAMVYITVSSMIATGALVIMTKKYINFIDTNTQLSEEISDTFAQILTEVKMPENLIPIN